MLSKYLHAHYLEIYYPKGTGIRWSHTNLQRTLTFAQITQAVKSRFFSYADLFQTLFKRKVFFFGFKANGEGI